MNTRPVIVRIISDEQWQHAMTRFLGRCKCIGILGRMGLFEAQRSAANMLTTDLSMLTLQINGVTARELDWMILNSRLEHTLLVDYK